MSQSLNKLLNKDVKKKISEREKKEKASLLTLKKTNIMSRFITWDEHTFIWASWKKQARQWSEVSRKPRISKPTLKTGWDWWLSHGRIIMRPIVPFAERWLKARHAE